METIPIQNVNQIIHGYCMLIVVVNKTGSYTLDMLKMINCSNYCELNFVGMCSSGD